MEISLTTPALLFPAISLLLLAYTNRFLALASLIRTLHRQYQVCPDTLVFAQIANLRYRIRLVRNMQVFGVASLFLCVFCMFMLFIGLVTIGKSLFGVSLLLMSVSLALSLREVQVSVDALSLQLTDLQRQHRVADMAEGKGGA
jgi:hypothetical protein